MDKTFSLKKLLKNVYFLKRIKQFILECIFKIFYISIKLLKLCTNILITFFKINSLS